jgi:hypothetical protein
MLLMGSWLFHNLAITLLDFHLCGRERREKRGDVCVSGYKINRINLIFMADCVVHSVKLNDDYRLLNQQLNAYAWSFGILRYLNNKFSLINNFCVRHRKQCAVMKRVGKMLSLSPSLPIFFINHRRHAAE